MPHGLVPTPPPSKAAAQLALLKSEGVLLPPAPSPAFNLRDTGVGGGAEREEAWAERQERYRLLRDAQLAWWIRRRGVDFVQEATPAENFPDFGPAVGHTRRPAPPQRAPGFSPYRDTVIRDRIRAQRAARAAARAAQDELCSDRSSSAEGRPRRASAQRPAAQGAPRAPRRATHSGDVHLPEQWEAAARNFEDRFTNDPLLAAAPPHSDPAAAPPQGAPDRGGLLPLGRRRPRTPPRRPNVGAAARRVSQRLLVGLTYRQLRQWDADWGAVPPLAVAAVAAGWLGKRAVLLTRKRHRQLCALEAAAAAALVSTLRDCLQVPLLRLCATSVSAALVASASIELTRRGARRAAVAAALCCAAEVPRGKARAAAAGVGAALAAVSAEWCARREAAACDAAAAAALAAAHLGSGVVWRSQQVAAEAWSVSTASCGLAVLLAARERTDAAARAAAAAAALVPCCLAQRQLRGELAAGAAAAAAAALSAAAAEQQRLELRDANAAAALCAAAAAAAQAGGLRIAAADAAGAGAAALVAACAAERDLARRAALAEVCAAAGAGLLAACAEQCRFSAEVADAAPPAACGAALLAAVVGGEAARRAAAARDACCGAAAAAAAICAAEALAEQAEAGAAAAALSALAAQAWLSRCAALVEAAGAAAAGAGAALAAQAGAECRQRAERRRRSLQSLSTAAPAAALAVAAAEAAHQRAALGAAAAAAAALAAAAAAHGEARRRRSVATSCAAAPAAALALAAAQAGLIPLPPPPAADAAVLAALCAAARVVADDSASASSLSGEQEEEYEEEETSEDSLPPDPGLAALALLAAAAAVGAKAPRWVRNSRVDGTGGRRVIVTSRGRYDWGQHAEPEKSEFRHKKVPQFIVAEIDLPEIESFSDFTPNLGREGLIVASAKGAEPLQPPVELRFSYPVCPDRGDARWDCDRRLLTVICPVELPGWGTAFPAAPSDMAAALAVAAAARCAGCCLVRAQRRRSRGRVSAGGRHVVVRPVGTYGWETAHALDGGEVPHQLAKVPASIVTEIHVPEVSQISQCSINITPDGLCLCRATDKEKAHPLVELRFSYPIETATARAHWAAQTRMLTVETAVRLPGDVADRAAAAPAAEPPSERPAARTLLTAAA